ncbi:cobalamin biosynthesis protein, partial [Albidovulum sp.]|uniref:cobalamin biosynthesis protein n=1 Tax=Albidovulum sp. TaxID=1872424 RepID=UPI0025C0022E
MRVAGIGFRAAATVESLADALGRAGGGVDLLATACGKVDAPAFLAFARDLGLPVLGIARDALARERTLTHSSRVADRFGTGSLAEAAALAAAGRRAARGLGGRAGDGGDCRKDGWMTVHFIGAGPGAADLLTLRGRD